MKKLSQINENIFDGIGKRSKGGIVRKEKYVESVDLGLPSGTIWASCNLGAESPEECGNYYAWGETEPKDCYYWDNYKFGDKDNLTKYNKEDGKNILDPEDDAVNAVLGGKWHIPTKEQMQELLDNTTIKKSELNGVKGMLFTSKTNSNTLFFPHSGIKSDTSVYVTYACHYWSSSIDENSYNFSIRFYSNFDGSIVLDSVYRHHGLCIRGVLDKK